jgi:hypothetical protein
MLYSKAKLVHIIFKSLVRTSKKTLQYEYQFLILVKEIIPAYNRNHTGHINAKFTVTDYLRRWYMQFPLGFEGLKDQNSVNILHCYF